MSAPAYTVQYRKDYKAPDFTATDIELEFHLSDEYTVVRNTTHFKRLTADRKAPLRLDGEDLELNEVLLNGLACQTKIDEHNKLVVDNVPDDFELTVENVIAPAANSVLMGLYKSGGVFCTQCEPEGFRRITYSLDRPDVLARYKVTIYGPEYGCSVLLSNGNLVDEGFKAGRHYCVWDDPFPKPSYLFALVAGTFDILKDTYVTASGRKVSVELYVDRGAYNSGKWALECIKQSMAWDEKRFGLEYDLDNFKVVAVDFFNQGAMENKSLNIFNSIYVLVNPQSATDTNYYNVQSVIGHEYFHNWTGDRVTLRDWFQLSLKESLTVFRDQEFSSDVASRAFTRLHAINVIRSAQFAEDASPMAHPVRPEQVQEMNNFYSVTIYDKGAEVIRMMHTIMGENKFKKALTLYLQRFDGKAATIDDFVQCMHEASGFDFTQFMRWYTQAGTPCVTASWSFDQNTSQLKLHLSQHTNPTRGQQVKEPFCIPVRLSFLNSQGQTVLPPELNTEGYILLTEAEQDFTFTVLDAATIPVLLRDFSAPVRLEAPYTSEQYRLMLSYCDDPFIRMDSTDSLIRRYVKQCLPQASKADAHKDSLPAPQDIAAAFAMLLNDKDADPQLVSMMVSVPSLQTFMEYEEHIELDALVLIRTHLEEYLAQVLYDDFLQLYENTRVKGPYQYNVADAGKRALHSLCLKMLTVALRVRGDLSRADDMVFEHYEQHDNMTDRLAALTIAVHYELPCAERMCQEFKSTYNHDVLAYDNYFRVQATAPGDNTVYTVRRLMREDKHYDKTNPNRVRALVGAMILSNPQALHRTDGTGYVLLFDTVSELNSINEHIAARILNPLLSFRRFDARRQELARECLLKIKALPELSRSVSEKVDAALQEG